MEAKPDEKLVQLKSLEALKEVANGEANKIFIPFEATSALSSLGSAAEADREARIRRAAGEAEAIKKVAEAKAEEVHMVYDAMMRAKPDEKLVQLKSLEALKEVANGEANKVFIPFEATSALASLGTAAEMFKNDNNSKKQKRNQLVDNTVVDNGNSVTIEEE